jgi:hypothetical protein
MKNWRKSIFQHPDYQYFGGGPGKTLGQKIWFQAPQHSNFAVRKVGKHKSRLYIYLMTSNIYDYEKVYVFSSSSFGFGIM